MIDLLSGVIPLQVMTGIQYSSIIEFCLLQHVACVFRGEREERLWRSVEDILRSRNANIFTLIPLSRTSSIFLTNAGEKSFKGNFGGLDMFLLEFGLKQQRKEKNCASTANGVGMCDFSHEFKTLPNGSYLGSFEKESF